MRLATVWAACSRNASTTCVCVCGLIVLALVVSFLRRFHTTLPPRLVYFSTSARAHTHKHTRCVPCSLSAWPYILRASALWNSQRPAAFVVVASARRLEEMKPERIICGSRAKPHLHNKRVAHANRSRPAGAVSWFQHK